MDIGASPFTRRRQRLRTRVSGTGMLLVSSEATQGRLRGVLETAPQSGEYLVLDESCPTTTKTRSSRTINWWCALIGNGAPC